MNLNSELGKRWATGLAGAIVFMLLITLGGWLGIVLITGVLIYGMTREYADMAFLLPDRLAKRYAMLSLAWLVFVANLFLAGGEYSVVIGSFLLSFAFFLFTARDHEAQDFAAHFREFALFMTGLLYVAFLPSFLPRIQELDYGSRWVALFFFVVWAADTGAYFAGKKFGGRKLYPQVSPKKTVSGAIGGLLTALFITLVFKFLILKTMSWLGVFTIPLFVGVASQVGDLCESLLKRAFDKKDSGTILPGHGGFLDRFDGVVFSAPVMYACIKVFG